MMIQFKFDQLIMQYLMFDRAFLFYRIGEQDIKSVQSDSVI